MTAGLPKLYRSSHEYFGFPSCIFFFLKSLKSSVWFAIMPVGSGLVGDVSSSCNKPYLDYGSIFSWVFCAVAGESFISM